jgi:glucose-1-phosphate thymidylyltransferase
VVAIAKIFNQVQGKYEITDVNKAYLEQGKLRLVYSVVELLGWILNILSLMQAGQFVQVIEERQGLKVGCIRRDCLARFYY